MAKSHIVQFCTWMIFASLCAGCTDPAADRRAAQIHVDEGLHYLEEEGEYEYAIDEFTAAIHIDPTFAEAYSARGKVIFYDSTADKAYPDLNRAIELDSDCADCYFNRGLVYQYDEKFDQAVLDFTEVIDITPRNTEAYQHRAVSYIALEQYAEAIADLNKILERDRHNLAILVARGDAYQQQGKPEEALADYSLAIELDANFSEAYIERAELKLARGEKLDAVIGDFHRAVESNPSVYTFVARGKACSDAGQIDKAIDDFTRAIDIYEYSLAYQLRGVLWLQKEEHQRALADFISALEIDPTDSIAMHGRGQAYANLGKFEEARFDLKRALRLSPDSGPILNSLAWLLATCPDESIRKGARAVQHIERAISLNQEPNWDFLDTQAAALAELGKYKKALATLDQSITVAPQEMHQELRKRRELYHDKQPYRTSLATE